MDIDMPEGSITHSMYAEVTALIDQHLFASAVTLGQYMVAASGGLAAPPAVLVLFGKALKGAGEWRHAVDIFDQALLQSAVDLDQADVRFNIAQCLIEVGDTSAAQKALEQLEPSMRTAVIEITLAGLYRANGSTKLAIDCYKNVLRLNPYAIEAAKALVDLRATEPPPLAASKGPQPDVAMTAGGLVQGLTVAYTLVAQEAHSDALETFEQLERQFGLTVHGLVQRGSARAAMKQTAEAVELFDQARAMQASSLEGGAAHAATLVELQCKVGHPDQSVQLAQLSKLAQQLLRIDQKRAAPWVASSYFCSASASSIAAQQRKHPGTTSGPTAVEQMKTAIR